MVEALGPATEIVVADGGSNDRTTEIAAGRGRVVRSPPGRGRQLNAGARVATGDVLLFLHADTWLTSGAGEAIEAALARAGIVGGCFRLALRGPSSGRAVARVLERAIGLRSVWLHTATGDQAIFARRSAFDRIGGFPFVDLFEDVLFYRRLRRLGKVVVLEPAVATSDRRWRELGYMRTIVSHIFLRALFLLGAPPARLARLYRRIG